jgi:D-alanyl-D-alanine carboxypeptidase/D-alanyl-D-alanine-endopeptidase (penicillin-binding protein 4)
MFYFLHNRRSRAFLLPVAHCLLLIFLASCSVQKQIAKSANENVLSAPALQTAHVGISIYEPAANKYWFNYQGDKYFVPASNTKIPACYAAMKYLGDSLVGLRYRYQEYLNTYYILPSGDPTFLHEDFKTHRVLDFYKRNIDQKFEFDVSFIWHEFPWGNGWSWNDFEDGYMAERSPLPIYGNVVKFKKNGVISFPYSDSTGYTAIGIETYPKYFQKKLEVQTPAYEPGKFTINRKLDENRFLIRYAGSSFNSATIPFVTNNENTYLKLLSDTIHIHWAFTVNDEPYAANSYHNGSVIYPGNSHNLIQGRRSYIVIHSQPTDSLLKPMMHRSDNFFAEQSLLMVSNERLGYMNDEKIIDTLLKTDFKDLPQKPRWADGSGLSRYNLFTPQDLVAILNKMKNEFGMERIKNILPTGGEGTLSSYYNKESGYIYAKTGTLSGIVSISGFLYTKKNKLLIFSILVNNHNGSATDIRRAVEKFIEGIRNKY